MSAAQVRPYKSGLVAQITLEPTPVEPAREGIEVIRTYYASCERINMPKIVNGFAYRCIVCNEVWNHRIEAYRHQCLGVTVLMG
jgi:hypothetical protein